MNSSMNTSASGMVAQQRMVDVIANNLANVNTTGFKRSRVNFEDVMSETLKAERIVSYQGSETVGPVQVGKGVRVAAVVRIHGQGIPETTDRPLDLAIEGDGFFQVLRPDGMLAYTRDGSLSLSDSGALVTNDGYLIQPGILVPSDATSLSVSASGIVSVTTGTSPQPTEVGRIELARFLNPSALSAIGENQYVETIASGEPYMGFPQDDGFGAIAQGALEASNVEIVQEMTDMITAQRAYEINARALQAGDEMMQMTNDLLL